MSDEEVNDLIEAAWRVISNVDWEGASDEWRKAAIRWRSDFHVWLNGLPK